MPFLHFLFRWGAHRGCFEEGRRSSLVHVRCMLVATCTVVVVVVVVKMVSTGGVWRCDGDGVRSTWGDPAPTTMIIVDDR